MQCNEIRNYFADYIKEELQGAVLAEFSQHLKECPSCNAELEGLTDIWVKVGSVPTEEPASPDMEVRFRAAVEESKQELNAKRHTNPAWWQLGPLRAAAVFVVLILLLAPFVRTLVFPESVYSIVEAADGSLYRLVDGKAQAVNVGERIDAGRILRTDDGAGAVLALPDGARIEMHEKSELSLEHADNGTRIRLNAGSVLVTPAKQPAGNLYVQNRETTVPVTGALFQSAAASTTIASQAPTERIAFELSSIRPSGPMPEGQRSGPYTGCTGGPSQIDARRFVATNKTLYHLITMAYGGRGRGCGVYSQNDLISGGPSWIRSDQFDVQALMPEGGPSYTPAQFGNGDAPKLQIMIQSLLADRFKLALHPEMKDKPVYALTLGKDGPKQLAAKDWIGRDTGLPGFVPIPGNKGVVIESRGLGVLILWGRKASMADLASALTSLTGTGRPILDRTGLTGEFNFDLDGFASSIYNYNGGPTPRSIFTALEEELGLKLESARAPVEVLVIDHAEKPSEN